MNFAIEVKDIFYLCANAIFVAGVILSMKTKITSLEREFKRHTKIMYSDKGKLNIVDVAACKEHRDQIFESIRRANNVMEQALRKIEELNKNVLTIMIYLQINPPDSISNMKMLESEKKAIDS